MFVCGTLPLVAASKCSRDTPSQSTAVTSRQMALQLPQVCVRECQQLVEISFLFVGGHDRALYLWDLEAGRIKHHLFGHRKPVRACKFSFNGEMLVSASYDTTVRLWDTYLGTEIATMNGHTMMVRCCDFSFDGNVACPSLQQPIMCWTR